MVLHVLSGVRVAFVRKRDGRWRARFVGPDGRLHEKAVPARTKAQALRLAHELEAQAFRVAQGLTVAPSKETVESAAARYLEAIRHHRSWKSIESRWRRHILPALGKVPAAQLRSTQVDELLAALKDGGYSQQTQRHVRVTLSAFFEWLIRDGGVASNPVERARSVPVPKGSPKALTEEQVKAVAAAATFEGMRHLVLLAWYTAARPGELLAARWEDFDLTAGVFHVQRTLGSDTTKTGKAGVVNLPPDAVALLREMRRTVPGPHLFLNASGTPLQLRHAERSLSVAVKRAGLISHWEARCRRKGCSFKEERKPAEGERCPKCRFKLWGKAFPMKLSPKDMRSSSLTHVYEQAGADIAQQHARHERIETTKGHYIAVRNARVAEAIHRAFGAAPPPEAPPAPPAPPQVHPPIVRQILRAAAEARTIEGRKVTPPPVLH